MRVIKTVTARKNIQTSKKFYETDYSTGSEDETLLTMNDVAARNPMSETKARGELNILSTSSAIKSSLPSDDEVMGEDLRPWLAAKSTFFRCRKKEEIVRNTLIGRETTGTLQ